jgi:hypothetical protein
MAQPYQETTSILGEPRAFVKSKEALDQAMREN